MKQLVIFATLIAVLASCTPDRNELAAKITNLQNTIIAPNQKQDPALGEELFGAYDAFFEHYSADSLVPEMLYRGGQIAIIYGQNTRAAMYFTDLINKYPDFPNAVDAYMILGNFYANKIYDLERAKEVYDEFLAKYPQHELAPQAQFMLKNLGKTPEELLLEISKQNEN